MQHISTQPAYDRRRASGGPASETPWHRLDVAAVLAQLNTTPGGLSEAEALERRARVGPNELTEQGARGPLQILAAQLTSVMVLVLLAAAGLSLLLGDLLEAGAILAIVVLFAVLGFVQEWRGDGHRRHRRLEGGGGDGAARR